MLEMLQTNISIIFRFFPDRISKSFNDTHRENCILLNSAVEFIETEAWLLLTYVTQSINFCYSLLSHFKGMLRPIFCIDINTHSDRI